MEQIRSKTFRSAAFIFAVRVFAHIAQLNHTGGPSNHIDPFVSFPPVTRICHTVKPITHIEHHPPRTLAWNHMLRVLKNVPQVVLPVITSIRREGITRVNPCWAFSQHHFAILPHVGSCIRVETARCQFVDIMDDNARKLSSAHIQGRKYIMSTRVCNREFIQVVIMPQLIANAFVNHIQLPKDHCL